MSPEVASPLVFHLTGRRAGDLAPFDPREFRPALFARYRDLTALRYDFPVVLLRDADEPGGIRSLSGLVDDLLRAVAERPDAGRVQAHVLRLEREIRSRVAREGGAWLSDLWQSAAKALGVPGDAALGESLERARALLVVDGEVVDCDRALPGRLIAHAWRAVQARKIERLDSRIAALVARLSDILRADHARSGAGRTPASLRAAVGTFFDDVFDFQALSNVLTDATPSAPLPDARRDRIRSLVATLEAERRGPAPGASPSGNGPEWLREFVFESPQAALDAHRARLPRLVEVVRALGMAELEARGEYDPSRHDPYFTSLCDADLDPGDLRLFTDALVIAEEGAMTPGDHAALLELLSSGVGVKVLVRCDDLAPGAAAGIGVRPRQLSTLAMGLSDVYVLQTTASQLHRERDRIRRGLAFAGPALFSVYSGGDGASGGPTPYLLAAAALESRAFPSILYDPSAGPDWASRCDLEGNPQVERDWPLHPLPYEDHAHQRRSEDLAFTVLDFLACDPRHASHFARVPAGADPAGLDPAAAALAEPPDPGVDRVPFVWVADGANALWRVVVDERLVREARRCREMWHSLQELGGIHNSYAERVLARERSEAEARARAATPVGAAPVAPIAPLPPAPAEEPPPSAAAGAPVRAPGEPYIETVRCSSCNECIQLNPRMFAYNANRQAYLADPDAGTYRELVEAAESCQVAVIHPGKPRNPNEPGLDELLERAAAFD